MIRRPVLIVAMAVVAGSGCTSVSQKGTLAELHRVQPEVEEIYLEDSLERAAQSYRRYLDETARSPRTPEAMRRLADLQLEQEYGVLGGSGQATTLTAPEPATGPGRITAAPTGRAVAAEESEREFERRATGREALLSSNAELDAHLPESVPAGPREAIQTYWKILETYPHYERSDQVLYQLARAYEEIGEPDRAMAVMDRFVADHADSKFIDEIYFRRGEYYFVRKKYLDAEQAYGAIIAMSDDLPYFELALYKLGWTLYKQDLYEEALHNFVAMLDYRLSIGFDFDRVGETKEQHRLADTFRVISLSFSNLGGPDVIDEYFSEHGHRSYADKIYGNLGEFYFAKLRYDDAASVYKSFVTRNPLHKVAPHFSMRVVEIYGEAGFPQLVVEAKKEFATNYALDAEYWKHFEVAEAPEAVGFLKTNLTDLAGHYHALYQDETLDDERAANFVAAQQWYRQFLGSFPADGESPGINYQLADLLLENEDFAAAAVEYERTAYDYPPHEQAAAAGYAAIYAHRQGLEAIEGAQRQAAMQAAVESSLKFADTFRQHDKAPAVLSAAADDLYAMDDFQPAIDAAQKLIDRYPEADVALRRAGWAVVAYSSIELAEYENAELAYINVLDLTAADDERRAAVIDGLAAAIYKQGEAANLLEDYRSAAGHFLRIKDVAPTSEIRTAAEYDAAAALMKLEEWAMASAVLEEFRSNHPAHQLHAEATKQLAFVYREDGQIGRSAAEHERIAAESTDVELSREASLTAGEMYDEIGNVADATRVYERYVADYPAPLEIAVETRWRLAEIYKGQDDYQQYEAQLHAIVAADRAAGAQRTGRIRFLAARSALVLAEQGFERFAGLVLTQPFEHSLVEKQARMDAAMAQFEALVGYEVAEVTAAATFYIAEIYLNFSNSLLASQRPADLSPAELDEYELALEEEAYPFEERAIEVHEENFELLVGGIYNRWVLDSLDKLGQLMPGRYAKNEISGGFLASVDMYAYRMPSAPPLGVDAGLGPADQPETALETALETGNGDDAEADAPGGTTE